MMKMKGEGESAKDTWERRNDVGCYGQTKL